MGLDCTAYRKIQPIELPPETEDTPDGIGRLIVNTDFPERADGIKDGYYTFAEEFDFAAGSYGGYGGFRNQLAKLAGYSPVMADDHPYAAGAWEQTSGPFWELINFADNEGVIGPATSAKLAKDFAEFQPKADALDASLDNTYFQERYARWRKAFEIAQDGGAVDFH